MKAASIERSVARALVLSIALVSLASACVSAITTLAVAVRRDDVHARAQALTLVAELRGHRDAPSQELAALLRDELVEQQSFGREVEAWRDGERLGPAAAAASLAPWIHRAGCTTAYLAGSLARVCAVSADRSTTIIVASALAPLLAAHVPIMVSIAASAVIAALAFAGVARRVARRALSPLRAFESALDSFPALERRRLPVRWQAAEVDQLATTFNALLGRIDAAMEREHRFVANAAHELRTPITRLRGQIELLQQDCAFSGEAARRLALAARGCLELGRSLESILALARDEVPTLETVDLAEVVSDAVASFGPDERDRVAPCAGSAAVRGDPVLLGLALRNLLDNALKYSSGPVECSITELDDGTRRLTVRDYGPGIAAADLLCVREPFVRGRAHSPTARGSGLGLALVEHVVKQHGGWLELSDGVRHTDGLRASILLPAWRPVPSACPARTGASPRTEP